MSRHVNIPVFIPHLGCPNQCVFCNQRTISGVSEFDPERLTEIIETALSTTLPDDEIEIAFFGGSFTGIDRSLMTRLLDIAYAYIREGKVMSIRCSTRPDYINKEILSILKARGVKHIELGLQSTSDRVLDICKRGHTAEDEMAACKMIVDEGFELIGQMMIGLPGATLCDELETAKFIIECGASGARIYPTIVFRGTELCDMACKGNYSPLSVEEAVDRSAKVYSLFFENKINVIRIGLCSSENLSSDQTYYSGPNHPALGEMVINRFYYDKMYEKAIAKLPDRSDILKFKVAKGCLSKAIGQKKINKHLLKKELSCKDVLFEETEGLTDGELLLEIYSGEK